MIATFNINRKTLQRWSWVGYPALVLGIVGASTAFVLFGGVSLWTKLVDRRQTVDLQASTIQTYRQKLDGLKRLDRSKLETELKDLAEAVPYTARVWEVVNLARVAGEETGTKLVEWKAFGGEVIEEPTTTATANTNQVLTGVFDVQRPEQLEALLADFEHRLPMVAVKRVVFMPGRTQIDLEGKWSAFVKLASEANLPLPQGTAAVVEEQRQVLAGYKSLPETAPITVASTGKSNPF